MFFNKSKNKKKHSVYAIIVAAGSGRRMASEYDGTNKVFIMLNGKPVLAHTLQAFDMAETVDRIIIVAREEDILLVNDLIHEFEIQKVFTIIKGGSTRQESVLAGLNEIPEEDAFVAMHDGARPLILPELIDEAVEQAFSCGAVTLGVPVKDTIKIADSSMRITETIPRENLWNIQTPQIFSLDVIKSAHLKALDTNLQVTDDCALVEKLGIPVTIVEGDYNNIKITTPEDLILAESIMDGLFI